MLSPDAIAEIRKRATSFSRDSVVIAASMDTPEDAQIVADYGALLADRDELVRRLGALFDVWTDNWDCSLSPGHDAMHKALSEMYRAVLAPAALGRAAPMEDAR